VAAVVEQDQARIGLSALTKSGFKGIVDLRAPINRYLKETNDNPKPFTWAADPDEIIDKVRRGKETLDGASLDRLRDFDTGPGEPEANHHEPDAAL
jgi:hypothetical protein